MGDSANDLLDLSFFWKTTLPYTIMNGDWIGPSLNQAVQYYSELFWDDLDVMRSEIKRQEVA